MGDKALTVSVSQGRTARQHDQRDYTPKNAARVLEPNNVCVVRVEDEVQAFNDFFEPSISAYNAKQKRADRKKSLDYHAEVIERRAKSKDPDHEVKPFYEYVVALGDRNGVMAVTDDTFDNDTWRRLKEGYTDDDGTEHAPERRAADAYVKEHLNAHPDREMVKAELTAYMSGLQERYPNFRFVAIEGHDDEPNGTFHFHIRFFPVGEGYKKGMQQQCGLNKALEQMGFTGSKGKLPITQWQDAVKRELEEVVLKSCGYEREPGDGRKERLETDEYILMEELEDMREEVGRVRLDAEQMQQDAEAELAIARQVADEAAFESSVLVHDAEAERDEAIEQRDKAKESRDHWEHQRELVAGKSFKRNGVRMLGRAGEEERRAKLQAENDALEAANTAKQSEVKELETAVQSKRQESERLDAEIASKLQYQETVVSETQTYLKARDEYEKQADAEVLRYKRAKQAADDGAHMEDWITSNLSREGYQTSFTDEDKRNAQHLLGMYEEEQKKYRNALRIQVADSGQLGGERLQPLRSGFGNGHSETPAPQPGGGRGRDEFTI